MPSAKSARVGNRKRAKNAPLRSRARTFVAKARRLISSGETDATDEAVKDALVALDKAAQRGALHANNAARRKSRLMRHLNKAADR